MRLFKCVSAFVIMALFTTPVFAHTNSIGYVGDGNGGLTFWYGSWHDNTTFNEAEIKIEGANGTTFTAQIDEFDLLSQDSPAGLISGVNFFTSDGTQLIDYDPDDPNGGGESYTWQGINYANLQPGDYTFTYIPLGDAESSYPNGTPTMEWVPMDQVIRTLTITLTQNDLDGDANNNGILDINEVAVGSASGGPTVTGQGSLVTIGYAVTNDDGTQTVARTQTTSTWDIYSDGTTGTASSTSVGLTPYVGAIDQIDTITTMMSLTNREIDFTGIQVINDKTSDDNGMTGTTTGLVVGGKRNYESGWGFGVGVGKLYGEADNVYGGVKVNSTMFNVHVDKTIMSGNLRTSLTNSSMDYEVNRVIGPYSNNGKTSGYDRYVRTEWVANEGTLRPIVGYQRGKIQADAYTETGDALTALSYEESKEDYSFYSVGFEIDISDSVSGSFVHDTDGTNSMGVGFNKTMGNKTITVDVGRVSTGTTNATTFGATLDIAF